MFDKILIANRGEIACRVIKTAQKMGIATVAVYSDTDSQSPHVKMASEAVHIGGSASADSYLNIDRILEAVQLTGAQAVHPGFGFLSENAKFASALDAAGVTFIGPGVKAIATMGDKIESKKLAERVGVNTIPGHTEAIANADQAAQIAEKIGCPIMIKASAGGGGKGMRIAWSLDEVVDGFNSAANEARASFGDDRVFIEKYIETPRHIEVQVLADQHGHCIYLGERECSIQRRHQKVIEEAPSPFIDPATRQEMGEQAVTLAKSVDYCSAGTVEFIVDKHRNFYFLEMNTRLQVEHPITEYITGIDLVEQMIRVANREKLVMAQSDVTLTGWALESRVYAEDPERNFMPSIGRLTHYQPPAENDNVRVDTGVYEGSEISVHYDPMIAKLITYGDTRAEAIEQMAQALDDYLIRGVLHNIPFLASLIRQPDFIRGDLSTNFIDQHYPDGFKASREADDNQMPLIALAASLQYQQEQRRNPKQYATLRSYCALLNDQQTTVVCKPNGQHFDVRVGDDNYRVHSDWRNGKGKINAQINAEKLVVQLSREGIFWSLSYRGFSAKIALLSPHIAELYALMPQKLPPDTSQFLLSPMPGLLLKLSVGVGDEVRAGQELAVVEAMKMENILYAERDGKVLEIAVQIGDSLSVDQTIMTFE